MFSERIFRALHLVTRIGNILGSCYMTLDLNKNLIISSDSKSTTRLKRNYLLVWFWAAASLALVAKYYLNGNTELYNLTLFFWIGGVTFNIVYSIFRWRTLDFVRAVNATLFLFKYLHGK